MQSHPATHTGSGGAAVHFAIGKDTDIATDCSRADRSLHKYGAVEEGEVMFKWMADIPGTGLDQLFDHPSVMDVLLVIFRCQWQAIFFDLHICIEGAPIGQVEDDGSQTRYLQHLIPSQHKRRHPFKSNRKDFPVPNTGIAYQPATGCIDHHPGFRFLNFHPVQFYRKPGDGDGGMSAHGRITLVVHEDDSEIGAGIVGWNDQTAVHIGMPARFPHQRFAQVVKMLHLLPPAFQNRIS